MSRPRLLALCAGYGGLEMAVTALTGAEVAYVADSDGAASLVLAHHYPEVPNLGDISTYDWTKLVGEVDMISAGFSCQDISNAGPREGIGGSRSRVWKCVAQAVGVIRPEYVFLENVAALRFKNRGLDVVAGDLAAHGYDLWWTCLRASDAIGAAHHRDRWFGVARPADAPGVGRSAWRTESAEQQGWIRRPPGRGGEPASDAGGPGLEVRGVESAREELPAAERSGVGAEDAHGAARQERLSAAPGQASRGGHGPTLDDEVSFLLPHAHGGGWNGGGGDESGPQGRDEPAYGGHSPAEWWGDYLPAVRRWENTFGRPAPEPTEVGPRGGRRLAAPFAEWLMGLPEGHVTAVPGLSRADQLHKIGNGAMPQQAYRAYGLCPWLEHIKEEAE